MMTMDIWLYYEYDEYGNPYLLASYRKEIKSLPSVKTGDVSDFSNFYIFVLKCEKPSKSTAWNALETPGTLWIFVSKLPDILSDNWNRKVKVFRRKFGKEPFSSDSVSFVHEKTALVNESIFSKDALLECVEDKKRHIIETRNKAVLPEKAQKW